MTSGDSLVFKYVETLTEGFFLDFGNRTIVNMTNGQLREFRKNCFSNAINLTKFLADRNHLSELKEEAFKGAKNLQEISLKENQIESIHGTAFEGLAHLNKLLLSRNNLKYFQRNTFQSLDKLATLDLSSNQLKFLFESSFKNSPKITTLDLSNNFLNGIENDTFPNSQWISVDFRNNTCISKKLSSMNFNHELMKCKDFKAYSIAYHLNELNFLAWFVIGAFSSLVVVILIRCCYSKQNDDSLTICERCRSNVPDARGTPRIQNEESSNVSSGERGIIPGRYINQTHQSAPSNTNGNLNHDAYPLDYLPMDQAKNDDTPTVDESDYLPPSSFPDYLDVSKMHEGGL